MSKRDPLDFYPTPPECVAVLRDFVREFRTSSRAKAWRGLPSSQWLDPCVGAGAIPLGMGTGSWHGMDLNSDAEEWCGGGRLAAVANLCGGPSIGEACLTFRRCDSLLEPWDPDHNVVENPPFSVAESFVKKTVAHVREHGRFGACLMRGQWIDDASGRRVREYRPDAVVRMCWRANFSGEKSGAASTHCWLVWLPVARSEKFVRTYYVEEPAVPRWRRDLHVAMRDGLRSVQGSLGV